MSFFIMGFQLVPHGLTSQSGLALKDQQALTQYANSISSNAGQDIRKSPQNAKSNNSTTINLPWIQVKVSLPHVDFGFDDLYGLNSKNHQDDIADDIIKF